MAEQQNVPCVMIDWLSSNCFMGTSAGHSALPNLRHFLEEAVTFNW